MRARLGRREMLGVFVYETSKGFIAALAEKIGFADGLIGQGAVESKGGSRQQEDPCEYREAGSVGWAHCRHLCKTLDGKNRGAVWGRSRWEPWGLFGFCVFGLALFVPAAKIKSDRHAGGAQFVRNGAVDHGTSHNHASDGQGSDSLCGGATAPPILSQAPLQDAHHCFEDGLEGAPRAYAATSDVSRQRDHGAGVLDILEMLARQISADDLRPYVGRRQIHMHAFPATLPF